MIADRARTYKGYLISYYSGRGCAITKSVPGRFFEKVVYIAFLDTERDCIDYIDNMQGYSGTQ